MIGKPTVVPSTGGTTFVGFQPKRFQDGSKNKEASSQFN